MKQAVKKVVTRLVMTALAAGTLSQGTMPEVEAKHKFVYDQPSPKKNSLTYDGIALMVETSKGNREVSTGMDSFSPIEIKQGKSGYAYIDLPKYSKAKSSSLTSSNKKVLKIVNKKQGKIKALKAGTTKLTAKVKWKYTGKARKFEYPVLKKISKSKAENYGADTTHIIKAKKLKLKKGKTYTFKVTVTVRVLCSKHKYSAWKTTKKATCSNGGEKQRKCKKCGTVVTKWLDELPHNYGEWKVTKPATQDEKGEKTRVCSVCGEEEVEDIDKLSRQDSATPSASPSQMPVADSSPTPNGGSETNPPAPTDDDGTSASPEPTYHSNDLAALTKWIAEQNAKGAQELGEPSGFGYKWSDEGRLIDIVCDGCNLSGEISFSEFPCLQSIMCNSNNLTGIDVTGCTELQSMWCGGSNLTSLDVSNCNKLTILDCSASNLSSLDVSNCTELQVLELGMCPQLKKIDVSKNTKLKYLSCNYDVEITGYDKGMLSLWKDDSPWKQREEDGTWTFWDETEEQ